MTAGTGLRGLDLLDAAIKQIEKHPETWYQGEWRCGSGMCVAGWACDMAGGEWIGPACDSLRSDRLVPGPDDSEEDIRDDGRRLFVLASSRARRLLGLDPEMDVALGSENDWRDLFSPDNTLAGIRAMRDDLRAHAAEVAK